MSASTANADQIAYWNDASGRTWAALQDALDTQLEPMGARVLTELALKPGERVIDVGCGCGQTTLALAKAVGASGLALGIDISEPMLAVARTRGKGAPQARFLAADAQTYPFEPATFDALHSRFGVMFFDDPPAAFANLRSALKPGGRLAFLCWRTPPENPIMVAPMAAAQPFLPPAEPPVPGAPGPFAFADPERVRGILTRAGFADIAIAPQDMSAGGNPLDVALDLAFRVGPLGRMLRENPDADRDGVVDAVRKVMVANQDAEGRVFMPSATWVVTARNP